MSRTPLVDRIAAKLSPDLGRRSFLSRTAMVGTALAVAPTSYVLRPGDAYSQVCSTPSSCGSGAKCNTYTEFCCVQHGSNRCPPGTVVAGWWRADGSGFCGPGAPRFYMDCNAASCGGCGCGSSGLCSAGCSGTNCSCWGCNCNNWKAGCSVFRYGNCNNHIACVGPINCRVVTCTPPWQVDPGCSTTVRYDNNTRFHDAPCLHIQPTPTDGDLWVVSSDGAVFGQNAAPYKGGANTLPLYRPIVGMAHTPSRQGYWLVASDGGIFTFGDAGFFGSTGALRLNQPIVGMASTPTGRGYWLVASDGGIFCFGDAQFYGSTGNLRLNQPVVGMAAMSNGRGYWLVARDGGLFTFGAAQFHGSAANAGAGAPFVGITGHWDTGYWLAAANGLVYQFGTAPFVHNGPPPNITSSMTAIAVTNTGNGYYLVGGDGSIYPAGDAGGVRGTALPLQRAAVGASSYR